MIRITINKDMLNIDLLLVYIQDLLNAIHSNIENTYKISGELESLEDFLKIKED